uniref:Uncharacterized protein n=1 Tax=Oryza punctata TaxID=4537 RepID=A0A0E0MNS0_ORYPU
MRIKQRLAIDDEILKPLLPSSTSEEEVNADGASVVVVARADLELPVTLGQRVKEEVAGAWGCPDLVVSNHLETGSSAKELEVAERRWPVTLGWREEALTGAWGHPDPMVPNHLETGYGTKELRVAKRRWPATLSGRRRRWP